VGILSVSKPETVLYGMEDRQFDVEGRVLSAVYPKLILVSAYFPNSQDKGARLKYKIAFCKRIHKWVDYLRDYYKRPVVLTGDFNIAHEEIDLARPDDNHQSAGFLLKSEPG